MSNLLSDISDQVRLKEREQPYAGAVMYQRWEELLFLHWTVAPEVVQARLPEGLRVDTFDGAAWIGVVPFQMRRVRPRFLPAVPWLSNFPELNLRTYVVDAQGRPGVWFYSLDTPQLLANWIARRFFHLNYRTARMQVSSGRGRADYRSALKLPSGWDAPQDFSWEREGTVREAEPGSLEFFLVERYRLFAYDSGLRQLYSGQVHHAPYPLQGAREAHYSKRLFSLSGLEEPVGKPVSVLCSGGVDVSVYPLKTV